MNEGPRTVVAQSRPTVFDVVASYDELSDAIDGVAAIVRMHQTESARLSGQARSIYQVMTAWRNATGMLEIALKAAEQARDGIMANALTVGRALSAAEEKD